MTVQLRPSKYQRLDFEKICKIGPEKLGEIADILEGLEEPPLTANRLMEAIKEKAGDVEAEPLLRQLLSLYGVVRRNNEISDVLNGLDQGLQMLTDGGEFIIEEWQAIRPLFERLLSSRAVRIAATAIELMYDYANIVRSTRILSDVRPVYDKEAENIESAVVSHTLRLHFQSADGDHELSLALDSNDIQDLMKQCARALKKADTAKKLMKKFSINSIISGDE